MQKARDAHTTAKFNRRQVVAGLLFEWDRSLITIAGRSQSILHSAWPCVGLEISAIPVTSSMFWFSRLIIRICLCWPMSFDPCSGWKYIVSSDFTLTTATSSAIFPYGYLYVVFAEFGRSTICPILLPSFVLSIEAPKAAHTARLHQHNNTRARFKP